MRQSNAEGGLSPPLPAAVLVSTSRTNMGVYEFKHPDTDSENSRPQNSPVNIKNTRILYYTLLSVTHISGSIYFLGLFMIVCHIFRLLKRMLRVRRGSEAPTFPTAPWSAPTKVARMSGSIPPTLPVEW
jgi:hypothetical protein